ncbi:MAG: FecR domain-containing protein [Acidobacteria bacterium]|nr:FecR domain-containing protein [Acidobacteriota bacterium]
MVSRTLRFASVFVGAFLFLLALLSSAPSAFADASHIRIIRISYVQGDVRFARDVKGDPLAGNENITWENAELNLPVRQGFVISTENGRAEVEFENGSLALIGENTVLQFFDLSLEDGSKTTRLILRQGTASFSVNPSNGDYFSVTGGDFSVEADGHSAFRLDNFDDGSRVNVLKGRVNILRKKGSTLLDKGQTFSMKADDPKNFDVATNTSAGDDFDKWAANRISAETNGIAAAQQFVNSPNYSSGLSSLYTYGAFYPCQFGNCWRPYGVGLGWSPFDSGFWFTDPSIGMSFIGNQPWGWLPYHYGGWLFDPTFGWLWSPNAFGGSGLYGGYPGYLPVTGTWLRNGKNGPIGIVPTHPLDAKSKTPTNLAQGVFPVSNGALAKLAPTAGEDWKSVKSVPTNTINSRAVTAAAPVRVERTMAGGNSAFRSVGLGGGSALTYDATAHRFVNSGAPAATNARAGAMTVSPSSARGAAPASRVGPTATARTFSTASRSVTPPSAPHSGFSFGRAGGDSSGGRSGGFSAASSSVSHGSSGSSSSSSSSSGGRAH